MRFQWWVGAGLDATPTGPWGNTLMLGPHWPSHTEHYTLQTWLCSVWTQNDNTAVKNTFGQRAPLNEVCARVKNRTIWIVGVTSLLTSHTFIVQWKVAVMWDIITLFNRCPQTTSFDWSDEAVHWDKVRADGLLDNILYFNRETTVCFPFPMLCLFSMTTCCNLNHVLL